MRLLRGTSFGRPTGTQPMLWEAFPCGCLLRTSAWTCRITWHWTWAFHLILLRHGWNSMLRTTSRPCRMRSLCSTAVPTRFPSTPEIARQIVRQDAFCNSTSSALRGLWRLRSQRWTPPGSTSECTGDSHELCCTSSSECTGDSHELCCTYEIFWAASYSHLPWLRPVVASFLCFLIFRGISRTDQNVSVEKGAARSSACGPAHVNSKVTPFWFSRGCMG